MFPLKPKVYIDGKDGTTGLQIYDRLSVRSDIDLLLIDEEKRKDPTERKKLMDAADIVFLCLPVFAAMIDTMTVRTDNMRKAAGKGFINATDCADYLTKKGMPFRDAYTVTGKLVAACTAQGKTLEELTLDELKAVSDLFDQDVYEAINLENCMALRASYGGPAVSETTRQIGAIEDFVKAHTK